MNESPRKRERDGQVVRFFLFAVTFFLLCLTFYLTWVRFYNPTMRIRFYSRGNYMLTILYGLVLFVCTYVLNGHKIGDLRALEVVISQSIALILCTVIMYFPLSMLQYSLLKPGPLLILLFWQIVLITVWTFAANKIYYRIIPPRKILVVYETKKGLRIADKMSMVGERYNVGKRIPVSAGYDAVAEAMCEYDTVLYTGTAHAWREWLARQCLEQEHRMIWVPSVSDIVVNCAEKYHTIDTPLLTGKGNNIQSLDKILKRSMDIVGSLVLLVVTSPILLITSAAIKICDGGPVIFKQERLTLNGKVFKIWKFRSMWVDAGKGRPHLAEVDDPRITPVGRIIRKFRIDELPQLVNVLKGEMSLVGPRPECPDLAAEFVKRFPEFNLRLKVKAGITGYAQVYGNYTTTPEDKLLMDLMYIQQSNIIVDIKLLLLTIRALFITTKTEGVSAEEPHDEDPLPQQ